MKKLLWFVLLVGCQSAPPGPPTPGPGRVSSTPISAVTPGATSTASPSGTPTPSVSLEATAENAVIRTADFVHNGLTNRARAEMLLAHLFAAGKSGLVVSWKGYPEGGSKFEVVYSIETIASLSKPKEEPKEVRNSPFEPTPRVKGKGIELTWTYDFKDNTCLPRDPATQALYELKPRLDEQGLEAVLPKSWRTAVIQVPTLVAPEPVTVVPQPPLAEETPDAPGDPIVLTGFLGEGKQRRAIITHAGQSHSLAVGQREGGFLVKSMEDSEVEIEFQGSTFRLEPGGQWIPGEF